MPGEPHKILQWDSDFFGMRIARYCGDSLTEADAIGAREWCLRNDIDCLYLLLKGDAETIAVAERSGFVHADTRVTLARPAADVESPEMTARAAVESDIPVLREIAGTGHRDGRFHHDGHFSKETCDAFYETWIENSCRGWADRVIVTTHQDAPTGYISCHISKDGDGSIGLIAVSENHRRKGFGGQLIRAALQYFRERGAKTVRVVTQERNQDAMRLYEIHGFAVESREFYYHAWPKRALTHHIPFNKPAIAGNEYAYIADSLARGHISGDGYYTRACQTLLEKELGVQRALLTTSCTHALEMCALLLDIRPGDEVIVPSFTFVSTVNAFVLRGAKPVFADIRPDTLNIDERLLEGLITPRTRAIVAVHYAGVGCEMSTLTAIAGRHGIAVIEDNAHGLFGRLNGQQLGTFGCLATQSFHETKNIYCGEGGALLINRPALVERAEIIREKGTNRSAFFRGQVDKYTWVEAGSSYVISDCLAAFLYAQLEQREKIQAARRSVWHRYAEGLSDWAGEQGIGLPHVPSWCDQSFHMFYVLMPALESRQALIEHLKSRGILSVFHYVPLHSSPMGCRFGGNAGDCPVTESISDRLLRLPFYNDLKEGEQADVIRAVRSFRTLPQEGTGMPFDLDALARGISGAGAAEIATLVPG